MAEDAGRGATTTQPESLDVADLAAPGADSTVRVERTVLYVEDEPLNAALLESIMSLLPGRTLRIEPTVADGIAAATVIRPALVLLDLNLPDGSGFDVLQSIRHNPALAGTTVFMLSADATAQTIQRSQELGADRFITKPFDLQELLALLDHHTQ